MILIEITEWNESGTVNHTLVEVKQDQPMRKVGKL